MRPIHEDLVKRLRRASPQARVIVEALGVTREALFQREDQWDTADSLTNIDTKTNGLVELTGSTNTIIVNATGTNFITDLNNDSPFQCTKVTLGGTEPRDWNVKQITARLHPKRTGGAKEVDRWRMRLWSLWAISDNEISGGWEIRPMGSPVDVTASGTVEAEFTFDFSDQQNAPQPKRYTPFDRDHTGNEPNPVMYVVITALKDTGEPAGNVGWVTDDAQGSKTTSDNKIQQSTLVLTSTGWFGGRYEETLVSSTPRMAIVEHNYTTATLAFTTSANQADLGAVPTGDVELMGFGAEPDDSTLKYEVNDNASSGWKEYKDGDLALTDNTATGGKDLTAVTKVQKYSMRVTLTTNTLGNVTPVLHQIGLQEVSRTNFDNLATVERVQWSLDPRTLKGEIAQADIRVERDGKQDFRDAITQVLMDNAYDNIEFRLWVGHPDLDRFKWLLVDSFPIIDDHDSLEAYIRFKCVSALAHIRQDLPVPDTAASTVNRTALEYSSTDIKTIVDDVLDNQVVLPGRYRGQGIADAVTLASKRIEDSDAKTELDAVCHLGGGGFITSQGRVKFVDMFGDKSVVHVFDENEITIESASPGLRQRVPEFFVPWNYDFDVKWYADEVRAFHVDALADLGRARIDVPLRLDSAVAQWIDTVALAQTIAKRHALSFGTGVRLWTFSCSYSYPELEVGDLVAIKTKAFVMRDPVNNRGLRGQLWVLGRICAVLNTMGTRFTVWIKDLSDVLPAQENILITRSNAPSAAEVTNADVTVAMRPTGVFEIAVDPTGVGGVGDRYFRFHLSTSSGFTPADANQMVGPIILQAGEEGLITVSVSPQCDWKTGLYMKLTVSDKWTRLFGESADVSSEFSFGKIAIPAPDELGVNACSVVVYTFQEGEGAILHDVGPNGLDATNSDTEKWSTIPIGTIHEFQSAVRFTASHATNLDIGGTQDFTIDVALRYIGDGTILFKDKDFKLEFASTGQIGLWVRDHWAQKLSAVDYYRLWTQPDAPNHPRHVLLTIQYTQSTGVAEIFVNGESVESMTLSAAATTTAMSDDLDIGHEGGASDFDGFMSYLRVIKGIHSDFPYLSTINRQPKTGRSQFVATANSETAPVPGGLAYHVEYFVGPAPPTATILILPPAELSPGLEVSVVRTDSNGDTAKVAADGTQKINGTTTAVSLANQYDRLTVKSDGSNWFKVGTNV